MKKNLLSIILLTAVNFVQAANTPNYQDPCQNSFSQSGSNQSIHELCTLGYCTDPDCDLSSLNISQIQTDAVTGKPCVKITSLANVNVEYAYLPGINLSGVDLTNTNMSYSCLTGANLQNAKGPNTSNNPTGAALYGSNLTNANLTGANLNGAGLGGALLQKTNFTNAILTNLVTGSVSRNTTGTQVTTDIGINTAFLNGTIFAGATFFDKNNSNSVDFSNTILSYINFTGANLTGVNLSNANLSFATFSSSNLTNAKLLNANATCTDFMFANLTNATGPIGGITYNINGITPINTGNSSNIGFTGWAYPAQPVYVAGLAQGQTGLNAYNQFKNFVVNNNLEVPIYNCACPKTGAGMPWALRFRSLLQAENPAAVSSTGPLWWAIPSNFNAETAKARICIDG